MGNLGPVAVELPGELTLSEGGVDSRHLIGGRRQLPSLAQRLGQDVSVVVAALGEDARGRGQRIEHVEEGHHEGRDRHPVGALRGADRPGCVRAEPVGLAPENLRPELGDRVIAILKEQVANLGALGCWQGPPVDDGSRQICLAGTDGRGLGDRARAPDLAPPHGRSRRPDPQRGIDPGALEPEDARSLEHLLAHLRAQALAEEVELGPLGLGHRHQPLDDAADHHRCLRAAGRNLGEGER